MTFVFVASILVMLPLILIVLFDSDKIINIMHESYPDEWVKAGCPCGYFSRPSGSGFNWRSRDRFARKLFKWWKRIDWIERNEEAQRRRRRVIVVTPFMIVVWCIGIGSWILEFLK